MHSVVGNVAPSYLNDMVTRVADHPGRACLRSASSGLFDIPRSRTGYGNRAFSIAGRPGPRMRNSLPSEIRNISSRDAFKKHLKTFLFNKAFPS